ncbi:MAG: 2-hydroxychromene-2-carboxylate isomerase [Pseudohongiellaceae bacterium]
MKEVDVYWSFRSPYSYLVTPNLLKLKQDFAVKVNLKVVFPIAIRAPEMLFTESNAMRTRYIVMDWARRARFLGMADQWPSPDPIVQDMDSLQIAEEQPHIRRLSYLGVEAQHQGRGIEFAYEVSHLLFGGQQDWHLGTHLAEAANRAGLSLSVMENNIQTKNCEAEIENNQIQLDAAGGWGVPTMIFEEEPFFGQDRIDTLRWHLKNCGLSKNEST